MLHLPLPGKSALQQLLPVMRGEPGQLDPAAGRMTNRELAQWLAEGNIITKYDIPGGQSEDWNFEDDEFD